MCGVIGFFHPEPEEKHYKVLNNIFVESKIRGLHSFGIAYGNPLEVYKAHGLRELTEKLEELRSRKISLIIGHNRYSTSGDWLDHANNQPVHPVQDAALVFNGVIRMSTREEYSKEFGKQYFTENDGEIILRKFLDGEDWAGFVTRSKFSFSGGIISGSKATFVRNAFRPLWKGEYDGGIYLASTRDIFVRAGFLGSLTEVKPGELVCLG